MGEDCLFCLACWLGGCWPELGALLLLLLFPLVFCFFLLGPLLLGLVFSLLSPDAPWDWEGPA